jgi:hypothetical protein
LAKYDLDKNGKFDESERAAMKADREKARAEREKGKKSGDGTE